MSVICVRKIIITIYSRLCMHHALRILVSWCRLGVTFYCYLCLLCYGILVSNLHNCDSENSLDAMQMWEQVSTQGPVNETGAFIIHLDQCPDQK